MLLFISHIYWFHIFILPHWTSLEWLHNMEKRKDRHFSLLIIVGSYLLYSQDLSMLYTLKIILLYIFIVHDIFCYRRHFCKIVDVHWQYCLPPWHLPVLLFLLLLGPLFHNKIFISILYVSLPSFSSLLIHFILNEFMIVK